MSIRTRAARWAGRQLASTWQAAASRAPADVPAAAALPGDAAQIAAVVQRCHAMVHRRSMFAAGVSTLPVPGLDLMTDVATLSRLIAAINAAFGLTPEQIEQLAPARRLVVYQAISAGGGLLVGRLVTRELVLRVLKLVGVRLGAQQAAKWVPVAGQVVSAALTYSSLRYVCAQHIHQCAAVARQLALSATAEPVRDPPAS